MTVPPPGSGENWHRRVFFGLHYDLHANAQDTELGAAVTPERLRWAWELIQPDWVQCDCKGHPGYTSWPTKVGYASPGIVRDALRIHRDVTRELGLPLVMHYSGIWDEVAMERHPEWARVDAAGAPERGRACPRSGYLTELLIPQMLELIDEYDVDGFWVDGDIWATRPCYCDRCRAAFAAETGRAEPPRAAGEVGWQDWLAWQRRSYEAYVRAYVEAVHRRNPRCLVCTNWLYSVRHPDSPALPVDWLSGDFSHAWGLERAIPEARFLASRGLPWDLMAWTFTTGEGAHAGWHTKTLAHLCQEAAEVVANAGALCLYVHPPRSGHLVGWQHELLAEVARFVRRRQPVSQESDSVPQAVVLHGQTHYYAHNEPLYGPGQAAHAVEGAVHALLDCGFHVDLQNEQGLLTRLAEYGLVVVPEQDPLSEAVVAALPRYVEQGGRLLLSGAHLARHPQLAALAGVAAAGEPRPGFHQLPVGDDGGRRTEDEGRTSGGEGRRTEDEGRTTGDGAQSAIAPQPPSSSVFRPSSAVETVTVAGPWQPVRLETARAWLPLLAGPEPEQDGAGTAAATWREVGRGQVAAIHGPIFAAYYRTRYPRLRGLLQGLFRALWTTPAAAVDAPGRVALTLRRQPGRTVVHLLNRGADPPTSPRNVMVERVPPVGPVVVRLRLPARPAGVRVVPDGEAELRWAWQDGTLTAQLSQLAIHAALVVDTA